VLYEAILLGSQIFHSGESRVSYYDAYFKIAPVWLVNEPERLDLARADELIGFVNRWGTRCRIKPRHLKAALERVLPELSALRGESLLHIDLAQQVRGTGTTGGVIERVFHAIASAEGSRYESTAASKMLHLIHPQLFVMWDSYIAWGYAAARSSTEGRARDYARCFLPRVQRIARRAVEEYRSAHSATEEQAVQALCSGCRCPPTLAKVVDEYNYVKFTWNDERVWQAEFEPPGEQSREWLDPWGKRAATSSPTAHSRE
jgi:hypothetical protein